jgi:type VI secretion system secreted protein Hcp
MAEMFLELDGVLGETLDHEHAKNGGIEIKSWSWNTENTVRWDVNQGGQSTKVKIEHIDLKKTCDKASPTLHQCCVTGRHIKKGKVTCRKNDGESKFTYLVVDMTDIMVSKFFWEGDGNEQMLNETVQLSFAKYNISYKLQNDTGSAQGSADFEFDIQRQSGKGAQGG